MSKTITIKGFVYEVRFGKQPEYTIFSNDRMQDKWYTLVGPVQFEYAIPESFNAVAAQVARIDAELVKARKEFAARVRELNEQRSNLLAIELSEPQT